MKYVDYREKLGLGFNDADKTKMLFNKIMHLRKYWKRKVEYISQIIPRDY